MRARLERKPRRERASVQKAHVLQMSNISHTLTDSASLAVLSSLRCTHCITDKQSFTRCYVSTDHVQSLIDRLRTCDHVF